jgi:tetratricopeptide (TPR) repeat protein
MRMPRVFTAAVLVLGVSLAPAAAHDAAPPAAQTNQIDPQAQSLFDQAEALAKRKQYEQAIAAYQQAVARAPRFAEAWNNMGFCFRKTKQYDKALDAYRRAIALRPDFSYPHEYMARTYISLGNRDAAMREYEILKRLDSRMAAELLKAIEANNADLGEDD